MTSMLIRPRTPADLDGCVRLLAEVHKNSGYPVNWPADPAGWLSPEGALGCWVLTLDGELAGHLIVTAEAAESLGGAGAVGGADPLDGAGGALVERLFVDPRRARAGLGRRLLEYAGDFAAERGLRLVLDVVDKPGGAVDFYRRTGWREAGRIPIDWGGKDASEIIRFEAPDRG
ncbi:GNAT family N-acetyltransferase [Kribbella sp. NPDC051620]|uniref:GNAT family N-acetyltransferase n=1 Tax=Kribbella sp. NPDC051620 TaxID=3364120 RepID=UPI0037BBE268